MLFSLQVLAILLPGYIRIGGLHLPVYGLFAALGLLAALWLSQRTAARVGIAPDQLWDAGVFAVVAAFIASRLLLIAFDLQSFLRFPLLMLALPSLTYTGIFLTGLMVWAWLRWKRLSLLDVLDAWAPCAALLAAVLSIGHFFEGTDAGMPTRLPWGVVTPGDSVLGRVHPVQIYAAIVFLLLGMVLLWLLRSRGEKFPGRVAAFGLMGAGCTSFLVDMLRQPTESDGTMLLDPSQFAALAGILAGACLWAFAPRPWEPELSRAQVAIRLEEFVERGGSGWFWDGFWHEYFRDPLLRKIQERCLTLEQEFPPDKEHGFCNEQGVHIVREYVRQLRNEEQ